MKIALDRGHGSDTPGKRNGDFFEWQFNEDVVQRAKKHFEYNGIEVVLTMTKPTHPYNELTKDGQTKNLQYRCDIANKANADYFVSVHANAASSPTAKGWEIYIYGTGGNAEKLAEIIQSNSHSILGVGKATPNRGIKTADFYVLKHTKMPAVLIEHAFYTNADDLKLLNSSAFRENAAIVIAKSICDIIGKTFKNYLDVSKPVVFDRGNNNREDDDIVKTIVTYYGDADVFAAVIVAQKLHAPLMKQSDFEASGIKADKVIRIGGGAGNRFDTFKQAADLL